MAAITPGYAPQARQALLHACPARWMLYGGAAGGGKSVALRWDLLVQCANNPGLDAYLFRRTLPQLENNHIRNLVNEVPAELGAYNRTRKRYELMNGSGLNFCYCESEADVENYQGAEMPALGIDEAQQLTPYQINYLISRVRVGSYKPKVPNVFPRVIFTANPGGVSHQYLKEVFIDRAPPETLFIDPETGWVLCFIPAKMTDNQYLDEGYAAQFSRMPEHMQKMLRDGDWNVVPGAYFDCWDASKNIVKPFRIPAHWTRFRSVDWGHATPFSIQWWAVASEEIEHPTGGQIIPEGALIHYREWYGALQVHGRTTVKGLRLEAEQVARGIIGMTKEPIRYTVCDPSAWNRHSGPSPAERMILNGVPLRKADNNREIGWQQMYDRILGEDGRPMLYVFESCIEYIRTVPVQLPADGNPEDIEKGPDDHSSDSARYACMSRPMMGRRPKTEEDWLRMPTFNELRDESAKRRRIYGD
jgi:hypothetical protein